MCGMDGMKGSSQIACVLVWIRFITGQNVV